MKWLWNQELTSKQAEETAKYLLSISQATVVGSVGSLFIPSINFTLRLALLIVGMVFACFLYLVAMSLLKGVKDNEYI